MNQPQAGRKHGFESDGAEIGLGKGQALGLDVLRVVIRHHDVDQAGSNGGRQRHTVGLAAQRRRHLHEGSVGTDVVLVQRNMVDRGRSTDGKAGILGAFEEDLEQFRAGQRGGIVTIATRRMSRSSRTVSAAVGMPVSPRRDDSSPSFITPSPARSGSCVNCTISAPKSRA